jgi:hypothetical protein
MKSSQKNKNKNKITSHYTSLASLNPTPLVRSPYPTRSRLILNREYGHYALYLTSLVQPSSHHENVFISFVMILYRALWRILGVPKIKFERHYSSVLSTTSPITREVYNDCLQKCEDACSLSFFYRMICSVCLPLFLGIQLYLISQGRNFFDHLVLAIPLMVAFHIGIYYPIVCRIILMHRLKVALKEINQHLLELAEMNDIPASVENPLCFFSYEFTKFNKITLALLIDEELILSNAANDNEFSSSSSSSKNHSDNLENREPFDGSHESLLADDYSCSISIPRLTNGSLDRANAFTILLVDERYNTRIRLHKLHRDLSTKMGKLQYWLKLIFLSILHFFVYEQSNFDGATYYSPILSPYLTEDQFMLSLENIYKASRRGFFERFFCTLARLIAIAGLPVGISMNFRIDFSDLSNLEAVLKSCGCIGFFLVPIVMLLLLQSYFVRRMNACLKTENFLYGFPEGYGFQCGASLTTLQVIFRVNLQDTLAMLPKFAPSTPIIAPVLNTPPATILITSHERLI